jgi:hypothetical protein
MVLFDMWWVHVRCGLTLVHAVLHFCTYNLGTSEWGACVCPPWRISVVLFFIKQDERTSRLSLY